MTLADISSFADAALFVGFSVLLFAVGWVAGANDGRGI